MTVTDVGALTLGTLSLGGGLTVISTGALDLGKGAIGGALLATSNDGAISQTTGGLTVTGTSGINAGDNLITLDDVTNNFIGAVSLTTTTSNTNAVAITDGVDDLTLGTLSLVGDLTVISDGTGAVSYTTLHLPAD